MDGFTHDGEFVLVAEDGANDLKNYPVKCVNGRIWVNNHAHVLQGKARIADNSFLAFAISQSDIESLLVGGGRAKLNAETLIGYQLSGENANTKNLITGTRYLNIQGMLPFENMVADYVKETGNHILYRSTPIFEGNNLLASGVLLEAYSVEDKGDGICFNVYCYNVQPDISIDYATGDSSFAGTQQTEPPKQNEQPNSPVQNVESTYILNTSTKKFHYPSCSSVKQMSEKNKRTYTGSRDDLISQGYDPCKKCNP